MYISMFGRNRMRKNAQADKLRIDLKTEDGPKEMYNETIAASWKGTWLLVQLDK